MSSRPPARKRARHQGSLPCALPPASMPTRPRSSVRTGSRSEGSLTEGNQAPLWTDEELANQGQVISISALPDDVLLPVFDYYLQRFRHWSPDEITGAWRLLAQVCRRWRSVIFGSPRRLDLRLCCTHRTRSRDMLDIWPALPLIICGNEDFQARWVDNIVAVLKHRDRVCQIDLAIFQTSVWEKYLAALQQPFPELTILRLWWNDDSLGVADSFLGGIAPRLEDLDLSGISFLGLPKLLLSATHLVRLRLHYIPHSGYISPDAMAAALSTLTSLEELLLKFNSPESCPDLETRRPPPSTRSVLPVLKYFDFKGASEYLEDLVTDIDAPQLNILKIKFFNDVVFDTPHLIHFIGRTPLSNSLEKAYITPAYSTTCVAFRSNIDGYVELKVSILCEGLNWQLSSVEQVCTSCLPFLSTLKNLYIHEHPFSLDLEDNSHNIENTVWLELLHPFTAVKNLHISEKIALRIGPALQVLVRGSAGTEVLPILENIFFERFHSPEDVEEGIGQFVAARQVSSHRVTVSYWHSWTKDMAGILNY